MTDEGSELQQTRDTFRRALKLSPVDLDIVDFIMATVVANTRSHTPEPVWGFICGPPGSAKTECLRTLQEWDHAVFVDELSMNSLASGYEDEHGKNPSLLPDLDGNLLIIKDFTTMIQAPPVLRNKIMGSLRSAYDGSFAKADGKTGLQPYKCRFGVLAAVTGILDDFLSADQQLGQRFVTFRMSPVPPRREARKQGIIHVLESTTTKRIWREALKRVVQANTTALRARALARQQTDPQAPLVSVAPEQLGQLADLADLTVRLRTQPYETGKPAEAEFGSRFAQQLLVLVECRAFADGRPVLNDSDLLFARRIARDSLPAATLRILGTLNRAPDQGREVLTPEQVAAWSSIDISSVYTVLRQLVHLGLAERPTDRHYRFTDDTIAQIASTQLLTRPKKG